jgi:hypothetical protein
MRLVPPAPDRAVFVSPGVHRPEQCVTADEVHLQRKYAEEKITVGGH